jgi:hypothetical protein
MGNVTNRDPHSCCIANSLLSIPNRIIVLSGYPWSSSLDGLNAVSILQTKYFSKRIVSVVRVLNANGIGVRR